MKTIRNYESKIQVLHENYLNYCQNCKNNGWKDSEIMDFREYTEQEADNDPGFFIWLFDDGELDRTSKLSDEQREEFKEFLEEL